MGYIIKTNMKMSIFYVFFSESLSIILVSRPKFQQSFGSFSIIVLHYESKLLIRFDNIPKIFHYVKRGKN